MKVLNLNIETEQFWINYCDFKMSLQLPLPIDTFEYKCLCKKRFYLFKNGDIFFDENPQMSIPDLMEIEKKKVMDQHNKCGCPGTLALDTKPECFCMFFKDVNIDTIKEFHFDGINFIPKLMVYSTRQDCPAMILFTNKISVNETMFDLFIKNFETYLNIPDQEGDKSIVDEISDDDGVHKNQEFLPRLTGGGRKMLQDFKYICQWCSSETLKQKTKGRFREIKNYRDHFRRAHQDVPFSEFLNMVERDEPKWQCKICRQRMSLGNQLRHQIICRPPKYNKSKGQEDSSSDSDSSSESDSGSDIDLQIPNSQKRGKKSSATGASTSASKPGSGRILQGAESSSSESDTMTHKRAKTGVNPFDESSDSDENQPLLSTSGALDLSIPKSRHNANANPHVAQELDLSAREDARPNEQVDDMQDEYEFCGEQTFEEEFVEEEVAEEEMAEKEKELPDHGKDDSHKEIYKWWQEIPKDRYYSIEGCPLDIFLPTDSKDFITAVKHNYSIHESKKKLLDETRLREETEEARLLQFSSERDQPVLDLFIEYVKNFSTKDIMNIFSPEYEEHGLSKGAKATTAKQYSYRIVEFFQYLSKLFHGFHLDWFFDYKCEIDKVKSNGEWTNDIFIPSKTIVTDFIKSFKYGSNPAANCGIRMFALKKLFDLMIQKFKDNVDLFPGSTIEKQQLVQCLVTRIRDISDDICPSGAIKHISIASNKNHRRILAEQLKQCPEKSIETIMQGVSRYLMSEDYLIQKEKLFELAFDKTKIPSAREYSSSTSWLLEQLICVGGNRPCALLGLTIRDWEERKAGFCPFNQSEENEMIQDDPECDTRRVLKDPYHQPRGSSTEEPTGVIVQSMTDKISVGPPCYIWFPNELEELVQAHSLMASKYFTEIDVTDPATLLFLNGKGNSIKQIECKYFKDYVGFHFTAYDFRRSLSTFCLNHKDENIRKAEPSVLRHRVQTGYAFYFQKHSENVEYVNIQYAVQNGLVKATDDHVNAYLTSLKEKGANDQWQLCQQRSDKMIIYYKELKEREEKSKENAKTKHGRTWILPQEYGDFIEGILHAVAEETEKDKHNEAGHYKQILRYVPGACNGGFFPPGSIWVKDMCRVMFGLDGQVGDSMREADLSVYHGVPFAKTTGRKRISKICSSMPSVSMKEKYYVIASYWRDKIRDESKLIAKKKLKPLRFIFNKAELEYYESKTSS